MTFLSPEYPLLLLATVALYWLLPGRARTVLLLAASYLFYCYAEPAYGLIIGASTMVDFGAALAIDSTENAHRRRAFLLVSVAFNLGLLGYFKYASVAVALPVGISFYTFQELAYTIDVYRRRIRPTHDLCLFATYVAFFPQLTAGPIERASHVLPQLAKPRALRLDQMWEGASLILLGLTKKLVLADRLAYFAGPKYQDPAAFDALELGVCLLIMPVSLYLDLAAYTDLARGSAKLFGIELSRNFRFPFAFTSPADFWQRWHMSLSGWIRDYVFVPLGGIRRHAPLRTASNAVLVMALFGLWHGAAWHFVLWGVGHGVALAAYYVLRLHLLPRWAWLRSRPAAIFGWLVTVVWMAVLTPLFFSPSWAAAVRYWEALCTSAPTPAALPALAIGALVSAAVVAADWLGRLAADRLAAQEMPAAMRGTAVAVLLYVVLFGAAPIERGFVYFQF